MKPSVEIHSHLVQIVKAWYNTSGQIPLPQKTPRRWQNEIRVHGAHGFSLPTMDDTFNGRTNEHLIKEISDRWEKLHDLADLFPEADRANALDHMRRIRKLQRELQTRGAVETMKQGEMVSQLSDHRDRVEAFLLRLISICAEHGVTSALPMAESWVEYQEAWRSRKLPNGTVFRKRFEQRVAEIKEQAAT